MNEPTRMLNLAARLALRAAGNVEPNPLVGAVIVRDGGIIGLGHHRQFGQEHAEVAAIAECHARGADPRGATIYITLEPCSHQGKQPPCTDAILAAGIKHVVYAREDPHSDARGGAEVLKAAGVAVELFDGCKNATRLTDSFVKRITTGLPWVTLKWAQTIDGGIATRSGESKWISSDASRARVHRLRARMDAVLTGLGTVIADDPQLTARSARRVRRVARRVVADPGLDIPLTSTIVLTADQAPTTVACDQTLFQSGVLDEKIAALVKTGVEVIGVPGSGGAGGIAGVDIESVLRELVTRHDTTNVLVEAGAGMMGAMIEADLADELIVYFAPLLLGDELAKSVAAGRVVSSLSGGRKYLVRRVKAIGDDIEVTYARA